MKVIGIMGGSGCGKSYLCELFLQSGAYAISADLVYHTLLQTNHAMLLEIETAFGKSIFENGTLNRAKLAEIVFHDPIKLERLNQLTHRYVTEAILEELKQKRKENQVSAFVIDAPLLHRTPLIKLCDEVVFVFCSYELRVQRIMERDGLSKLQAKQRIDAQPSDAEFQKYATISVDGNSDRSKLYEIVRGVID